MINLGSTELSKAYVGSLPVEKIYVGSEEVWSNFTNSRIDKSGTQSISPTNTWGTVVNWIANASYPSSVITNNGILVPVGMQITYTAVLVMGEAPSWTTSRGQVKNGSTVLKTVTFGTSNNSVTISGSMTGTGEVITLEAFTSSSANSRHIVQTSTYLLVEKV